ncbi:glutamine synthetase [Myxococcaceae bacterium]|nr:glutamine synthetase [Myxococcaceae bacterium]
MKPREVRSAADARKIVEERGLGHVKVGLFDVDGILRGKYMSRAKFLSALDGGFGFCDVVLGWDSQDQLYDNVRYTGWHTAYPDAPVRIVPESCREVPTESGMLMFLAEFTAQAEKLCPRGVLRRVLADAGQLGFEVRAALEYEFFVFDETPHSVREKGYRNLRPITPGHFGYSMLRTSVLADFHHELLATCEAMDMPLEGLHTETGPGVLEAAIAVDDALAAADKAALFKTFAKVIAQRRGWMATFMAKWSMDWPGQSGHVHVSLVTKTGKSAFYEAESPHGMSRSMRHFLGGQQALLPEFLLLVAPTVNSYRRLVPGYWAPTAATWGVENRTCALRVIPGSEKSQRIEYRIAAADANPYLALAAAIASGLHGIRHQIEPGPAVEGNAYEKKAPAKLSLPTTLLDAARRFGSSKAACEAFGDEFVEHFAATREWEDREARKHVSDWELARYFEIV